MLAYLAQMKEKSRHLGISESHLSTDRSGLYTKLQAYPQAMVTL
jgi:hypothetical protein